MPLTPRPCRLGTGGLSVLCAIVLTMAMGASSATATTKVFEYTGGEQTFVVPSGVHKLQVRLIGGAGGEGGSQGGQAAELLGSLETSITQFSANVQKQFSRQGEW